MKTAQPRDYKTNQSTIPTAPTSHHLKHTATHAAADTNRTNPS